jgi:large subunit ribosomal protein L18
MARTNTKLAARIRRHRHIRKRVHGTAERPRMCVFRSAKHIYAQLVDDETGTTLVAASSLGADGVSGGNREGAALVGKLVAERAKAANIGSVVFDRNGFKYHGRVAALADAAREAGLQF